MKGKHLDEKIKKALESLEVPASPGSWDAFKQRLDAAEMDAGSSFDKMMADRMGGFAMPLSADGWDKMEQIIEAEEAAELIENEALIDNIAYEKLHRLEVPLKHSHWHLMAKRLEEEFSLRHKLYRYKIAELALMALLLLTIIRFLPHAEGLFHIWENQPEEQIDAAPVQPIAKPEPSIHPQNEPLKTPAAAKSAKPAGAETSNQSLVLSKNPGSSPTPPSLNPENETLRIHATGNHLATLPPANVEEVSSSDDPLSLSEVLAERKFRNNQLTTPSLRNDKSSAELLASLKPGPVQSKYACEVPKIPQQIFEKESELRFSLFTATDINYVFTPQNKLSVFDTLVPTDPDTTLASGYGGGILISWKKDRWEIQTGGVYSFKRYIPNTPVFLFETVNYYVREEFNGVQLDLLQVPFNLQYHFKNHGKWRFYGIGGLSAHLITSSVYEISNERTPVFKIAAMPPPEGALEDDSTIREEKEFPDGLFDGGKLRDNFYLTANLGLGAERFVSSRWSIFFQPNYQHYLMSEGIGTNKDKFYTLSFYLGTKVNLK